MPLQFNSTVKQLNTVIHMCSVALEQTSSERCVYQYAVVFFFFEHTLVQKFGCGIGLKLIGSDPLFRVFGSVCGSKDEKIPWV